jgi:hypothetical protein
MARHSLSLCFPLVVTMLFILCIRGVINASAANIPKRARAECVVPVDVYISASPGDEIKTNEESISVSRRGSLPMAKRSFPQDNEIARGVRDR